MCVRARDLLSSNNYIFYINCSIILLFTLFYCFKFKNMTGDVRSNLVRNCNKSFRCLGSYLSKNFTSHGSFKICGNGNHHTLLHWSGSTNLSHNNGVSAKLDFTSTDTVLSIITSLSCHIPTMNYNQVILWGTSKVPITYAVGNFHLVRALMDSGSQTSTKTSACVI